MVPLAQPDSAAGRLLTVTEVATRLRVSNMTVYRLVNSGEMPAVRIGKSYRIYAHDLDKYLADRYTQAG